MDYLAIWQPTNAERILYSEKRVDNICFVHFSKERGKRSMKGLIHIRKTDISVKKYRGQLVATFRNIDTVYMIDQTEQQEEALNKRKEFYTCSPFYFPPWRNKGRF